MHPEFRNWALSDKFCYVTGDDNDLCNGNSGASLSKLMSKGNREEEKGKERKKEREGSFGREGRMRRRKEKGERRGGERERENPT